PTSPSTDRQRDFTAAATEFDVPVDVLLAVSYGETAWEAHGGRPSTTGAYGPMALVDLPAGTATAKGDQDQPALHTLTTAATLVGADPATLKSSDQANIRGGAALLASYADGASTLNGWYDAVARYGGGRDFADTVFATIRSGAARHTDDGQNLTLTASPNATPTVPPAPTSTVQAECPRTLTCTFIPAAYQQTGPSKLDYGNYDFADRPTKGLTVDYIVLHDTEESYAGTIATFQDPFHFASAHYVVDGVAGTVTQMVPTKDVAWHAGNWYVNMHSVGIEQVGFAVRGATWFTERMYQTTAALVRYLAARYGIRLDRQHIIGHDDVPGISPAGVPGMHWDPGPFWDWGHFMNLLGQHTFPTGGPHSKVVTINPVFADNIQTVTDCEQRQPVPAQAASFVYLRTAPSPTAPLFNDPGLNPTGTVGTTCAADWGDKASAGQQFAVADRQGDWIGIWWDGSEVWFENLRDHRVATPTSTFVVQPKSGRTSIPTYGVAYPDASDYPADIPPKVVIPLPYTIQTGQSYVFGGTTPTDYYYAQTIDNSLPDDHTDVHGTQRYLEIQLGHRVAFVNAADVLVVPANR
ncbi:MAG TPA: peptidoglycan recognition family protein, partial [Pseudonocardiaceae bacterium]|nr:peptidoglycan recognition family protein [Pseudonocardiaceae bacterium]